MKRTNSILVSILFLGAVIAGCKKEGEENIERITPKDFLDDQLFNTLLIEVKYVEGFEPDDAALNNLKAFLEARLNKPGGIIIEKSSVTSPGGFTYSAADLDIIEDGIRTNYAHEKTLTAFLFYADKGYAGDTEDTKVLGVAYGTTSMAIFKESIDEFSGGLTQPSETLLETTVLEHEFGHVLGLVNNGAESQSDHEDAAHRGHCDNPNCLMYYTVETSDFIENLLSSGTVPLLDEQCLKDLRAQGGK